MYLLRDIVVIWFFVEVRNECDNVVPGFVSV